MKSKTVYLAETAGDTLLLADKGTFTAVGATDGKKRFAVKGTRALRLGDDFAVATEAKGKVTVQRIAGATGDKAWTAEVAGAGSLYSFTRDDGHVVVGIADAKAPTFTVASIDAKSGAVTWTTKLPFATYHGAAVTDGTVVVEEKVEGGSASTFHVLDAATGKVVAKLPFKNAMAPLVTGGRLYVATNDTDKKTGAISALDVKTGKAVWTTPTRRFAGTLEGVTAAGLVHSANGMLEVYDVAKGSLVGSFGAPRVNWLQLAERGSPLATLCDDKETLAIDAGGAAETAKVTGTITCPACDEKVIPFHIGDAAGKTDAKGAFALTVTGAGRYEVVIDLSVNGDVIGGSDKYVLLAGKGAYDLGTITVAPPEQGD